MNDCRDCKNCFVTEPMGEFKCLLKDHYIHKSKMADTDHTLWYGTKVENHIEYGCPDWVKGEGLEKPLVIDWPIGRLPGV